MITRSEHGCGKTFANRRSLQSHISSTHKWTPKAYEHGCTIVLYVLINTKCAQCLISIQVNAIQRTLLQNIQIQLLVQSMDAARYLQTGDHFNLISPVLTNGRTLKACEHGCNPDKRFMTSRSYHKHQEDRHNNSWAPRKCSVPGCLSNNIFKSRMRWRHYLRLQHHFGPDQIAIYLPHQGSKSVEWRVTSDALKCPLGC